MEWSTVMGSILAHRIPMGCGIGLRQARAPPLTEPQGRTKHSPIGFSADGSVSTCEASPELLGFVYSVVSI